MMKRSDIPLQYYPLWLLLQGLGALPFSVLYLLSDMLYVLVFYVIGYRKKVTLQNLRMAFPKKGEQELKRISKDFYRQFMDVLVETLKLSSISKEEFSRRLIFPNPELLGNIVKQGKQVITMGSHTGNWEWILSAGAIQFDFPTAGVYKPLNNPFFEAYMLHLRSRLGPRLIKMKETLRDFAANRNTPRVVAMLSDQTPLHSEITFWTKFMHQETPFYVGAEKIASKFNCPVLFLDVQRIKRGYYRLTFDVIWDGTPFPENTEGYPITEAFAQKLEASLRRNPADYLWTHKRWKHKRPANNS